MKINFIAFFFIFLFLNKSYALIEVDITRGNLDPLPIAVSPLHVDVASETHKELIETSQIYKNFYQNQIKQN